MDPQEQVEALWQGLAALELGKRSISSRKFRLIFGLHEQTVHVVYQLYFLDSPFALPKFILWLLSFLKDYERDGIAHLKFVKCNERTFRDTIWEILSFLSTSIDLAEVCFFFSFINLKKKKIIHYLPKRRNEDILIKQKEKY
jgi:hypothetical protein